MSNKAATAGKAPAGQDQTLPAKFANLFKQVVRCYEQKQYKKGIKTSDQILKKHPTHGETLAMKGLILNCMDKKVEGEDFIRQGLKYNIKSHVCWHVYGLLHRSNRNYSEAIKCYLNALRIDVDNLQILKDLSLLQVQMRDMAGFSETRRKILIMKSSNRNNWIAYAIGQHLAGDYVSALEILNSYEKTIEITEKPDYEQSEMLLYKNQVIEESGNLQGALEHLDSIKKYVTDHLSLKEKKADLLVRLGRISEAHEIYLDLIDVNPDNIDYHSRLLNTLGLIPDGNSSMLTGENLEKFLKLNGDFCQKYPKSSAVYRLPLDFVPASQFHDLIDPYLQQRLRKGIPSLFRDVRALYQNSEKFMIIDSLLESYLKNLRSFSKFSEKSSTNEAPSVLLWTLAFAAQHFDFQRKSVEALKLINEAIEHTPTSIDLYLIKARIYKHAGDYLNAYLQADHARRLDLADRYLNTIAVKYAWRAHKIEEAEATAGLFLKDGDKLISLFEMQAMWYELASGMAYMNMGLYGGALKKFTSVQKHFEDMHEDQFDFHQYCLRKMTLRSYVACLRFEDNIRDHKFFRRATKNIVECYLRLADEPQLLTKPDDAKRYVSNSSNSDGLEFLHTSDPLGEASKHVKLMELYCPKFLYTHSLASEVYIKRRKYVLALRAIQKGLQIDPHNPELHYCVALFFTRYSKDDNVHPLTRQLVESELGSILDGKESIQEYVNSYQTNASSLKQKLFSAKVILLSSSKTDLAVNLILSVDLKETPLQDSLDAYRFLSSVAGCDDAATSFKAKAAQAYPLSTFFNPDLSKSVESIESKEEDL